MRTYDIKRWLFYGINKTALIIISTFGVTCLLDIAGFHNNNIGEPIGLILAAFLLFFNKLFSDLNNTIEKKLESGILAILLSSLSISIILYKFGIIQWNIRTKESKIS